MNMDKLTQAIEQASSGVTRDMSRKSDLTEQQQADKLLESVANFANPPTFKAGDLVRYRMENTSTVKNARALHVVLQVIAEPYVIGVNEENAGSPVSYKHYDLFLGVCDPHNNDGVLKYPADSRDLELWPDADRLKRQGTA